MNEPLDAVTAQGNDPWSESHAERRRIIFNEYIGPLTPSDQVLLDQMCSAYLRAIARKPPAEWSPTRKEQEARRARKLISKVKISIPRVNEDKDEEEV